MNFTRFSSIKQLASTSTIAGVNHVVTVYAKILSATIDASVQQDTVIPEVPVLILMSVKTVHVLQANAKILKVHSSAFLKVIKIIKGCKCIQ